MGIYDAIKDVVEVARKADNIDLVRQLLDVQKELVDLLEENHRFRERIRELEELESIAGSVTFEANSYWRNIQGRLDGPYCSTCWDVDRKLVRKTITRHADGDVGGVVAYCAYCTSAARLAKSAR